MTLFNKGDLLGLAGHSRMERGAALIGEVDDLYEDEYSLVGAVHDGGAYVAMVHHGVGQLSGECDCADGRAGTFCEHLVAVGLCYLDVDESDQRDGFGYLGEITSLWDAATADELHKVLVLHPTRRSVADAFEPEQLFRKHHATQPEGALVTAFLLLTDSRWHAAASRLVRSIAAAGFIDDDGLDVLASSFLQAGRCLFWTMPDHWFDGPRGSFVVELDPNMGRSGAPNHLVDSDEADNDEADDDDGVDVDDDDDDDDGDDEPAVSPRIVATPLRRWAAARLVSRDPAAWKDIWRDAELVQARRGAAIKCGVLDAVEVLLPADQDVLIREAVRWSHHSVRQLGHRLVLDRQGVSAAHALAKDDPNTKIRSWAAGLLEPAKQTRPKPGAPLPTGETRPRPELEQESLF